MRDLVKFLFEKTGHQVREESLIGAEEAGEHRVTLALSGSDIQKFSASEARLMRAMRALLSASAAAKNTKVTLEINEI